MSKFASGVYAIVWDDQPGDVLCHTKGGWPHITLGYSKGPRNSSNHGALVAGAQRTLRQLCMRDFTLVGTEINHFTTSKGVERFDVLLVFAPDDEKELTQMQEDLAHEMPSAKLDAKTPHVTHGIYSTAEEAEEAAASLKPLLPRVVRVAGVTVD